MRLNEITGPECPNCACRHSTVIRRWLDWNKATYVARQCRHCGKRWSAELITEPEPEPEQPKEVAYPVLEIRCPACGSADTKVKSTRRPLRFHKCGACGHCFKSRETTE